MSTVQPSNITVLPNTPENAQLQGRVDAIEDGRIFGWVWDRSRPAERLQVQVALNGKVLVSAVADMPRVDLRRNGIGDGGHAFEIELPDAAGHDRTSLSVVATSPSTGKELVLSSPNHDERASEVALNAPLNRVFDRLEMLIEAQRRSQLLQRDAVEALRSTSRHIDEIIGKEDGIAAALGVVRSDHADLAKKISDLEVFHMRFDRVLADFARQIDDLRSSADRPMRRAVALLAAFGGISAASAVATLVVLMRHPPW